MWLRSGAIVHGGPNHGANASPHSEADSLANSPPHTCANKFGPNPCSISNAFPVTHTEAYTASNPVPYSSAHSTTIARANPW